MIVNPGSDHMGILFLIVGPGGLAKGLYIARVKTDVVSGEGCVSPKDVLAPEVGVLATLVHGCVGLEVVLNILFVLLKGELDILRIGIGSQDAIKVTTHAVLLVVEAVVVSSADGEDVLSHQLAKHAPKIRRG